MSPEAAAAAVQEEVKNRVEPVSYTHLPLHPRCKCAVKYVRVKNENIQ